MKDIREKEKIFILSDKQLQSEFERCEYCEEKPCRDGCPVDCSAADFIMAAKQMQPQDFLRAAAVIMKNNPLGGICGMVCPDRHCMAECSHKLFDSPINIPDLQAEIVSRAYGLGGIPGFMKPASNGRKIAVVGAGPAGLGAAAVLAQKGYRVDVYEKRDKAGGMCRLIPEHRLDRGILEKDLGFVESLGDINIECSSKIEDPAALKEKGYDAVIVSTGLWEPIKTGARNEDLAVTAVDYLSDPENFSLTGKVAVIGGGATALDCAVTARIKGAASVEMVSLEKVSELPLTAREREEISLYGIEITGRTRVTGILEEDGKVSGIETVKVDLEGEEFSLGAIKDIEGSRQIRNDIEHVILAVGNRAVLPEGVPESVFFAGDCACGPTTVVEAVASGKNAAVEADMYINGKAVSRPLGKLKSREVLKGYDGKPVSLETDFFGRKIDTPFLLSAAPPSDGYLQMKKAYDAGWSGGVMKTAFDNVPIHIPSEYMHVFNSRTYGNCDNVSGHNLGRVCGEIDKLVSEYPDRLTMASTGGPVSGDDASDMKAWQANTAKLEQTGVMGIEYSLSCPQGGDGTEGDIVSQNAQLTAKIVDWVMAEGRPDVPKLFKLTAAVTSVTVIIEAIKEVLDRYPAKKAGVTLANTFPVMGFQARGKQKWENGVLLGMSGESVAPISYFTLSRAVPTGVEISGNGGPMNYMQAANFLALGVKTVQFCTIVMKYGYGIIDELKNGVSYLMKSRGIDSMKELIGIAQPDTVTDFMDLAPEKKISSLLDSDLCVHCGNCTRCPYLAIELDEDGLPVTDPSLCIGCSICTKKCFTGALYMRERTPEEMGKLKED